MNVVIDLLFMIYFFGILLTLIKAAARLSHYSPESKIEELEQIVSAITRGIFWPLIAFILIMIFFMKRYMESRDG